MKKIIFAALILCSVNMFSQATYTDEAGKWRLGLNAGAMWQTSDVTPHAGIAGGFTIERILTKKTDALIGFSLGFRYLSGNCTGLDTKASYGVANNKALNGTYDSTVNYAKQGGIFYNNYKTYIHEGALELKINFPRFEQKTHLIFHVMGGLGICNYRTWINALDINGNMYNFTALQNMQNVTAADVRRVLNGSNGTFAEGSPSSTTFVPSVGVGFGFKLSKHASLVFEYRASFPGTNLLDGVTHDMNNEPIRNNDFYNYASANLMFTLFGRQTKSSYNPTPPAYSNANTYNAPPPPINNNTYYENNYPTAPVNNTPIYNNQPQVYPPYVNITSPINNYSSQGNYISVQGVIQNIQSANQVSISQNGYPIKYFSYDPYSGNFSFQTFLQQGTNNIIVTANSQYGTGSQGVTVFYNPPYTPSYSGGAVYPNGGGGGNNYPNNPNIGGGTVVPVQLENRPIVQFINPSSSPEDAFNLTYNVTASVQNVELANQITVSINGNNIPQFNFNPSARTVNFTANLLTGYNSIHVSATNAAGTDAKSTVIDYKPVGKPPRVEVFNPASNPYTTLQPNMIVNGYVYNVASSSDITVNYNGNVLTFNYNNNTHEIDIPVNLQNGSNQLSITANNTFGNDVKQLSLVYVSKTQPTFTINPNTIPHGTQTQPTYTINPHINLGDNGNQTTPTFTVPPHINTNDNGNQTTPTFTVPPHINTNDNGNQTQPNTGNNGAVLTGMSGVHHQPEITLTSPQSTPYTTMSGVISISANLNYVISSSNVSVTYNGSQVSHSFNPNAGELLNFTSPLKPGMNTFVIQASNGYGAVTKNIDINYVPTNPNGNVNGNPGLHFTNGINSNANTPRGFTNTNVQPVKTPTSTPNNQPQITPPVRTIRPR